MYVIEFVGEDKFAGRMSLGASLSPVDPSFRYTFGPDEKGRATEIAAHLARQYGPTMLKWEHDEENGCQWLVQVASNNPEPDSIADCYRTVPCGDEIVEDARYPMCKFHHNAMTMDNVQFEAEVEAGRSWS